MKNNFICAIDFGASKISGMVGLVNKSGKITSLSMEVVSSKGIKNGRIADFSALSLSLEELLKKLQKSSGFKIKDFYVNVSGNEITSGHSRAIIPLAQRGNKVITDSDIHRVKEQARILGTNLQEEIIHEIPFGYIVDADNFCRNPRELYAHRLEIDLLLIYAKLSYVQSVVRLSSQLGYSVKGVFYPGFINGELSLGQSQRRGIEFFCDIGADTTDLVMFKDGALQAIMVLAIGGNNITQAISQKLNIPFDLADDTKRSSVVIGSPDNFLEDKEVMVSRGNNYMPIKQKEISRIATEEATKMCLEIKYAINKMSSGDASAEAINCLSIAGRTVLQEGFMEKLEELAGVPVRLIRIQNQHFLNNEIHNELTSSCAKVLTYLNPFSMIAYALDSMQQDQIFHKAPPLKSISGVISKVKQVYQQYF